MIVSVVVNQLTRFFTKSVVVLKLLMVSPPTLHGQVRRGILMSILAMSATLDLAFLLWIIPNAFGVSMDLLRHTEWWSSTISLVVSLSLLQMTRKGHVQLSAIAFIVFAFVATWATFLGKLGESCTPVTVTMMLPLIILSQMFCGLLLDFRANVLLALCHVIGLSCLMRMFNGFELVQITGVSVLFGFSVLLSATTAFLHHFDMTEIIGSRKKLEETVEELRGQILAREQAEKTKSELEDALMRTQRMEALARLAGGFAHDFNNALMGVLGQLERIRSTANRDQKNRIDEAIHSVERASGLIKGMLSLTHPHDRTTDCRSSDLALLMKEGFALARGAVPLDIEIELHLVPGIWALADQGQIVQVLLNLCVNARDALEPLQSEEFKPKIRLSMGAATREEAAQRGLDGSQVEFAWIQVEDNGPGIPPESLEKIFDPFYTTKEIGKGSGLGLWMCDAIARGLGGQILHIPASTPGQGACFRLYLPMCEPASQPPRSAADASSLPEASCLGRILLVDDDDAVRDNVALALSEAGWEVTQAFDGICALERFKQDPDGYKMMVLDLSLPGMPGREVLMNVRGLRPRFPILVITGFDLNAGEASPSIDGASGRLLKPFRTQTLLREIQRIEALA